MTKIILSGCNGTMGKVIAKGVADRTDCEIVTGVDLTQNPQYTFSVVDDFSKISSHADVIIDFSHPSVLQGLLAYAQKNKVPTVICTTGYSSDQIADIKKASQLTPIFYSGNMSLGINLLIELAKKATAVFGNQFDIEIIEKHHNKKLDAPSGTALMIADGIADVMPQEPQYIYDRHSTRKKREKNEIGLHAIRGGTIVGEHEVIFAGHDEVVSIKHQALSKEVFVTGAINAAIFLETQKAGLYNMGSLLGSSS
ncbi:4-hydroxy-tetrahydrodipicolinate reductase [Clostridia bacterium]|nr:4-hydroxy-tetrahydrodipicolinate reductase [Clostridia bacterium]